MFQRHIHNILLSRLQEPRRFIQVLTGPRQVGKTTLARQVIEALSIPAHYASADGLAPQDRAWIEQQWDITRLKAKGDREKNEALLVLDEVQKIHQWSEVVKSLWDEDTGAGLPLKVVLLGSAPLLIQKGLTESLAGRFETIPFTHWSFAEMQEAFGLTVEQYIYFGGYPGAAPLIDDQQRWSRYIIESLIETTISKDILLLTRVDKPALLRRLFRLGCEHSGQVLSYQKMLGQLQDVGNTTTLAHYLELLAGAGMVAGLDKFSGQTLRQRASSPKLQVLNTALMSAQSNLSFEAAQADRNYWGRLLESAIGAHLLGSAAGTGIEVFYWREGNKEVDFVLRCGKTVVGIEVKSSRNRESPPGMTALDRKFKLQRKLLVGGQGIPVEEFLLKPTKWWM